MPRRSGVLAAARKQGEFWPALEALLARQAAAELRLRSVEGTGGQGTGIRPVMRRKN